MRKKGYLLVIDGSNGAGKSTLIDAISKHLKQKNQSIIVTREPGGTPIGEKIRDILLNPATAEMCDITELMLFAAARAQHVREKIMPAMTAGKIVISDRFDAATRSFQHYARGLPLELINQLNEIAIAGFKPNLNIILDLDPLIGLARVNTRGQGLDRMESEKIAFLNKARHGYLIQAKNDPQNFEVINAALPLVEVISKALKIVDDKLLTLKYLKN